ncbi:MAG: hypothetical protein WCF54_02225, partial [Terracidiphilus sp.]
MSTKLAIGIALLVLAAGLAPAQEAAGGRRQVMVSSGGLLAAGAAQLGALGQLYREIDDPN